MTIGDGTNTWKSVTVTGSSQTGKNEFTDGTALSGTGKLRITSNSGSTTGTGVRISKIEIYVIRSEVAYSGYCTTAPYLSSIAVSGTPTKTTYNAGEALETAGLVVSGTYSDGNTATITEGISWTRTPTILAAGATSCKVVAHVGELNSPEFTVTGISVSQPTGPTDNSSTYTSNVTLSGSNKVTINGVQYSCATVGSSKNSGSTTFTVPRGTKYLTLHVVGWKGENGKTHSILTSVGSITPGSLITTADDSLSGNAPYALSGTDYSGSNYYFVFELSNVDSEATITISNNGGSQRAIYFGVNAE